MDYIDRAKEVLQTAQAVLITAGAGMGVDSGLPDFRGDEGFWRAYPYAKKLGLSFEDLANPRWFKLEPHLAWAFYGHRLNLYRDIKPHQGFYLLREFVRGKQDNYFVYTSNVDGQFQKAGFSESRVAEVHGSIHFLQCSMSCSDDIWSSEGVRIDVDMETFRAEEPLPRCRNCGRIARPNILMFGDCSWIPDRTEKQQANLYSWLRLNRWKRLVVIEIGAGVAIPTVRLFGEMTCREYGGTLIRINPRDYNIPDSISGIPLPMGALEALRKMFI